jgi:hypothetical protein
MAEMLEITKIRNYELSNGTTVDLVALIDNMSATNRWRTPLHEELAVGQVAYVSALGEMRRGVISKITKTKVSVTFTTQGAIDHAGRYRKDGLIRVQTTVTVAGSIFVAPLSVPEQVTKALLAGEEIELETPEEEMVEVAPEQDETIEAERAELDAMLDAWEGEGGAVEPIEYPCEGAEYGVCGGEPHTEDCPSYVAPLDPITGSAIVAVLEETWETIRADHPDLPHVVIVTGSGFIGSPRWAHWRESGWTERQGADEHAHSRHGEMFVAGEALAKGAKHVLESMIHEGAHTLATVRGISDTSRQGRWHNGKFRELAEELGLAWTGDKADPTHGFSNMLMTAETEQRYAELISKLDEAIRAVIRMPAFVSGSSEGHGGGEFIHGGKRPKTGTTGPSTNNLKLTCECEEPKIIRASKKVAELGVIRCDECGELFEDRS